MNPTERIMATLNIGLQNCALDRDTSEIEADFKKYNSMNDIRNTATKKQKFKQK